MSYIQNITNRSSKKVRGKAVQPCPGKSPYSFPYVDTLYEYTKFLDAIRPIASFPTDRYPVAKVAVIGAGAGGMVAAYELLRAGIQPVVLEATDRIGGRTWSKHFDKQDDGTPPLWAEMGAMRVPVSQKLFWYYACQFGVNTGSFPDPGQVLTLLYYQNKGYSWKPKRGQPNVPPPGPFTKIQSDFQNFIEPIAGEIFGPWQKGDLKAVTEIWQKYINRFREVSVYDMVRTGIPVWGDEELNAFSALGVGSGGFGTLYRVGSLELLRNVINSWEIDQQLIVGWQDENGNLVPDGINGLTKGFYRRPVKWPNGQTPSLEGLDAVRFNARVTRIENGPDPQQKKVYWTDQVTGEECMDTFAAVVVAVSTRSMEIDLGMSLPVGDEVNIGDADTKDAMRNLFHTGSSKMLIRTGSKFWLDENGRQRRDIPQTIQTDELPRGVYCLDYPHTQQGVVIVSYTWGDDSTKLASVEPGVRFRRFKEVLARICPPFAENLVPANGESDILNVDWESAEHYYGAFKLQLPGQDRLVQKAYYQFLSALDPDTDPGVYLVGDSVSWSGGWVEGALQTGVNAACAVARRLGGSLGPGSPLSQDPGLYNYNG